MRYLIGVLGPASLGAAVLIGAGCSAGTAADLGSGGGTAANGPSTGTGFGSGGGSTGSGMACTDPACVGTTPQGGCDTGLALDGADPMDGARAIGLCKVAANGSWGVTKAEWVNADGSPLGAGDLQLGKGILTGFGPNVHPREGMKVLALSSGSARQPTDLDYHDVGDSSGLLGGFWKDQTPEGSPPGYPKDSPSCAQGTPTGQPYDSAGLRLSIHTPKDAKSISYNLDFYTFEFPNYICQQYNDFFVAMMSPKPSNLPDGNISFDSQGNTISVNAGFLQVCNPQSAGGKNYACPLGPAELQGTGFEINPNGSAATGWLETKAPIEAPGSDITLQFAIWDSADGLLDSTVLIDNFQFQLGAATTGTTPIPK